MGTVVVGVDGSAGSKRALEWAVRYARALGGSVTAVYAYTGEPRFALGWAVAEARRMRGDEDLAGDTASHPGAATLSRLEGLTEQARRHAEELLEASLADVRQRGGVDVTGEVVPDRHPGHELVERSKTADLLVVGTRGHGGFSALLLGSVSHQCVQHASCPVVVVP